MRGGGHLNHLSSAWESGRTLIARDESFLLSLPPHAHAPLDDTLAVLHSWRGRAAGALAVVHPQGWPYATPQCACTA